MDETTDKRVREAAKLTKMRKYLARMLTDSRREHPQGTGSAYMPADPLLALKKKLAAENPNVTMTSLYVKVAAAALVMNPIINATMTEDEFITYDSVNIGVGIGTEQGIMVVVIKEAQAKNIFEISDELQEDIALLKAKKLPIDRMNGSTFTVSNMGMLGVEQFTPFVMPGELGILGIGTTNPRPWVDEDGSIVAKNVVCLSITIDHGAIDGLHGGRYLISLKEIMKEPEKYMGI
jgi:pyruvate dehydrogenase E2 component (dihydrolipoamide acetyltransferase)